MPGHREVHVGGEPEQGEPAPDGEGAGRDEVEQSPHHRRMSARVSTAKARPR